MGVMTSLAVITCLMVVLFVGVLSVLRDLLVRGIHAPPGSAEPVGEKADRGEAIPMQSRSHGDSLARSQGRRVIT